MTQLIANEAVVALLGEVKSLVEIRDRGGRVIGYYAPVSVPNARENAGWAARIDPAELARRKQPGRRSFTTRQVFEHLLTLATTEEDRADLQRHIGELAARERCDTP
jgi:hypothetical protein